MCNTEAYNITNLPCAHTVQVLTAIYNFDKQQTPDSLNYVHFCIANTIRIMLQLNTSMKQLAHYIYARRDSWLTFSIRTVINYGSYVEKS